MVSAARYVEAPATEALPFGLLDAAVVINDSDPHNGFGTEWEPEFCGPAELNVAACMTGPAPRIEPIDVHEMGDDTNRGQFNGGAQLPAGTYTIDWGDGSDPVEVDQNNLTNATHIYDAPGDYTVTATGPNSFFLTADITVVTDEDSGPFEVTATYIPPLDAEDGFDLVESHPFTVYHLFQCRLIGAYERGADRARRSLELGESRAVEQAFANILSDAAAAGESLVDDYTVADTPMDIVDGLALLEQLSAQMYGGIPTIHGSRVAATALLSRNALVESGNMLRTRLRSKFSAGAGYEGWTPVENETVDDGEDWLIATGTVVVRRAEVIETGPVPVLDQPTNEFSALAIRPENIGWECFTIGVRVTTGACCP